MHAARESMRGAQSDKVFPMIFVRAAAVDVSIVESRRIARSCNSDSNFKALWLFCPSAAVYSCTSHHLWTYCSSTHPLGKNNNNKQANSLAIRFEVRAWGSPGLSAKTWNPI